MRPEVMHQLVQINHTFYEQFAQPFHHSRLEPVPGFFELLDWLPATPQTVLDVGCGDGRWGYFLAERGRVDRYVGVDNSPAYLAQAQTSPTADSTRFTFRHGNMLEAGFLAGLPHFDLVVCLSALQHVPSRARRATLLLELAAQLAPHGRLILGNWQFLASERQRRKLVPWASVGLTAQDVEVDDYLLRWQRQGQGVRYVAQIDEAQTAELTAAAQLHIIHQFRSDGREGNLNLYTICQRAV